MALAALVSLLLSLAVLARFVMRRPDVARAPLVIGLLIGAALAIVAGVAWVTVMTLVDAEREAREKDIAGLRTQLDNKLREEIKAETEARNKAISEQIKAETDARNDAISKQIKTETVARKEAIEQLDKKFSPQIKPEPNARNDAIDAKVTLNSAEVQLVPQTRGKPLPGVSPRIGKPPGVTIQSADIDFCSLDSKKCEPAPPTDHRPNNFIYNGQGSYVTIPDKFDIGHGYCLKMTFSLRA